MCFQVKFPARETPKVDPAVTHGVERETLYKKLVKCLKEGIRPGNLVCVPLWGMIINHII
jgi:hypothetical protein